MKTRPETPVPADHPSEVGEHRKGGRSFFGFLWRFKFIFVFWLLVSGCASHSSRFTFTDKEGRSVSVDLDKEYEATDLRIEMNASAGTAIVTATSIKSKSADIIRAEADQNAVIMQNVGEAAGKAAAAALKGSVGVP